MIINLIYHYRAIMIEYMMYNIVVRCILTDILFFGYKNKFGTQGSGNKRSLYKTDFDKPLYRKVMYLLNDVFGLFGFKESQNSIKTFTNRITLLETKKGSSKVFAFLYLKECYRLTINTYVGIKVDCDKVFVSRDKKGYPRIIPIAIREKLYGTKPDDYSNITIRYLLSAFSITRLSTYVPIPDYNSITKDYMGKINKLSKTSLANFKRLIFKGKDKDTLLGRILKKNNFFDFPMDIQSACPSGKNAMYYLFKETTSTIRNGYFMIIIRAFIYQRLYSKMLWYLWLCILCIPYTLYDITAGLMSHILFIEKDVRIRLPLGKIVVLEDAAGKSRLIAIVNYWLQNALSPLHSVLTDIVKESFPDNDFTHDQNRITRQADYIFADTLYSEEEFYFNKIGPREAPKFENRRSVHSIDLKNATDRIPLTIQKQILDVLGFDSNLWEQLINLDFLYVEKGRKKLTKYKTGQPLGAYSSFAMLSLTHHFIIQEAYRKVAFENINHVDQANPFRFFKEYCVLGDDVVIWSDLVHNEYLRFLKLLDVDISTSKGYNSPDIFEFAKRIYTRGSKELTPFSPKVITLAFREEEGLLASFYEGIHKDFLFSKEKFINFIEMNSKRFRMLDKELNRDVITYLVFLSINKITGGLNDRNLSYLSNLKLHLNFIKGYVESAPRKYTAAASIDIVLKRHAKCLIDTIIELQRDVFNRGLNLHLYKGIPNLLYRSIMRLRLDALFQDIVFHIWPYSIVYRYTYMRYIRTLMKTLLYVLDRIPLIIYISITPIMQISRKRIIDNWTSLKKEYDVIMLNILALKSLYLSPFVSEFAPKDSIPLDQYLDMTTDWDAIQHPHFCWTEEGQEKDFLKLKAVLDALGPSGPNTTYNTLKNLKIELSFHFHENRSQLKFVSSKIAKLLAMPSMEPADDRAPMFYSSLKA